MIIQVDKVNDDYRVCCSAYPALVVIAKTKEEAIKNFELELDKEEVKIPNPRMYLEGDVKNIMVTLNKELYGNHVNKETD